MFFGKRAGENLWHSNTLEWTAPVPSAREFSDSAHRFGRALRIQPPRKRVRFLASGRRRV